MIFHHKNKYIKSYPFYLPLLFAPFICRALERLSDALGRRIPLASLKVSFVSLKLRNY